MTNPGDSPDSVVDAVKLLESRGYGNALSIRNGKVHCKQCDEDQPLDGVEIDEVFRFEGASNPDDESIVMGVRCPACGVQGSIVSAYGPGADPEVLDALVMLESRYGQGHRGQGT